jgi:hypothetical protein
MAAPVRTPEQRAAALEAALHARRLRAQLRVALKSGGIDPAVIVSGAGQDASYANLRVRWLLESLPGVGPIKAEQVMERLGIAATRRVGGLNDRQRDLLIETIAR